MLCRVQSTIACADITDLCARRSKELPDFSLVQNISDVRTREGSTMRISIVSCRLRLVRPAQATRAFHPRL